MGELLLACAGGVLVSLFNKFVLSGYIFEKCVAHINDDDSESLASQSSTISADVHVHSSYIHADVHVQT
jgi:hypothetical protein